MTSEDNTVEDVLPGVTLNLLQADEDTTVTLNVVRDIEAIIENISAFVDAYNEVSAYIGEQQSYDKEEEETGGIPFGDGTLSSIKADLSSLLVEPVWGVASEFSILGLVGINLTDEGQLEVDTGELEGFLDAITTNETFFFRTEKHFTWLKTDLVTEVVAQHRAGKRAAALRIWISILLP